MMMTNKGRNKKEAKRTFRKGENRVTEPQGKVEDDYNDDSDE
jgi:hypothetical protein